MILPQLRADYAIQKGLQLARIGKPGGRWWGWSRVSRLHRNYPNSGQDQAHEQDKEEQSRADVLRSEVDTMNVRHTDLLLRIGTLPGLLLQFFTRHAGRAVQVGEAAGGSPEEGRGSVSSPEVDTASIGSPEEDSAEIGAASPASPAFRLRAIATPMSTTNPATLSQANRSPIIA